MWTFVLSFGLIILGVICLLIANIESKLGLGNKPVSYYFAIFGSVMLVAGVMGILTAI